MKLKWKLFIILLIASILGILAVLPYSLTLQGGLPQNLPVPFYVIVLSSVIQNAVLFAVAIFIGLTLYKKVGLGLPIIEGWLEGKPVKDYLTSILPISIGLGLAAGILIIGFQYIFSILGIVINAPASQLTPPAWQGLLASFYGGINEEILLRLFIMTLLVWLFFKIKKTDTGKPTKTSFWLAIIIAAILFGAGHLPTVSAITTLNLPIVAYVITLNSIGGIIFGWLYWKKGLESAMIAHFSADIILHVIPAILISTAIL